MIKKEQNVNSYKCSTLVPFRRQHKKTKRVIEMSKVGSLEELRNIYNSPKGRALTKQLDYLDPHCCCFIERSPFLLLGTQAEGGLGDVSPRGEGPGFVRVQDEHTLLIPDRPGNNRLDGYSNIIENPVVSLLFMIPGVNETLRINGVAEIRDDEELCKLFSVSGKLPVTVLMVTVKEAYLHCAKALMRSKLWSPETVIDRTSLPTIGQMINDQTGTKDPVESQTDMEDRYNNVLY